MFVIDTRFFGVRVRVGYEKWLLNDFRDFEISRTTCKIYAESAERFV